MKRYSAVLLIIVMAACLAAGCLNPQGDKAKQEESARLSAQVAALERENGELKAEVQSLKDELARAQGASAQASATAAPAGTGDVQAPSPPDSGAPPSAAPKTFDDIKGVFGEKDILALAELGVLDDTGAKFEPLKPLTRATFVRWLVKADVAIWGALEERDRNSLAAANIVRLAEGGDATFTDVPPTHPDFRYIQGMCNAGYVIGYDEKTFKPDRLITREEMVAIKVGFDCRKKLSGDSRGQIRNGWGFTDTDKIADKYTAAIHYDGCAGVGYVNITRIWGSIRTFNPQKAVTRSEAAVCVAKMGTYPGPTASEAVAILRSPKK